MKYYTSSFLGLQVQRSFFRKHDINNVIKQKNKFLTAELLNSLAAH